MCGFPATWRAVRGDQSSALWTYCERHRPADAERIPADAPYYVTRLTISVAVTGAPGSRQAAADEAIRRITGAVEGVGGLVTGLAIKRRMVQAEAPAAPSARLELAGRGIPAGERRPAPMEAPSEPAAWGRKRRRTG